MKSDDTSMYDDPSESAFVRELLQAGRRANVEYDVERGLAKHLATISAGGAAPYWAAGAGAVAKRSVPLWIGYVTVPLVAAGVAGLLWVASSRPEPAATPSGAPRTDAISAPAADGVDPGTPVLEEEAAEPKSAEHARASAERRAARASSRAANPSSPAPARAARTSRGPSEAPAIALAEQTGTHAANGTARTGHPESIAANPYSGSASASSASSHEPHASGQTHAVPRAPEPVAEDRALEEPATDEAKSARAADKRAPHRPIADESRLEREMQMLAVTQRVLASDPERALRLAQQGEREFPDTMFSAERRQLGLLALVKLGRLDEARREGKPFLARYPKAPWSERLRRALATGQVE